MEVGNVAWQDHSDSMKSIHGKNLIIRSTGLLEKPFLKEMVLDQEFEIET
jgi:hypothetical protein